MYPKYINKSLCSLLGNILEQIDKPEDGKMVVSHFLPQTARW